MRIRTQSGLCTEKTQVCSIQFLACGNFPDSCKKSIMQDFDANYSSRHTNDNVCFAQAFFIRCVASIESGQDVLGACAKAGRCAISATTRAHCKACRYRQCLRVGMAKKGRPVLDCAEHNVTVYNSIAILSLRPRLHFVCM